MVTDNKHDELEPSMSRLVIFNHVKEGIELAHKYHLNHRIIDFIPEHHGTSLMHYFYQKALSEGQPDGLEEKDYRYPGPKPQSKETAIVLLADSVEGATRALDEHTPQRIEDVVRKVINNKFIDGQLDECNLTLRWTTRSRASAHTRPQSKPWSWSQPIERLPSSSRRRAIFIPTMIDTNVSFVGSTAALAGELMLLGPRFAGGVIVTQVVPAVDGYASAILKYKTALAKYFSRRGARLRIPGRLRGRRPCPCWKG